MKRAAVEMLNSAPEVVMDTVNYSYMSLEEMENLCKTSEGEILYVTTKSGKNDITGTVRDLRFGPRGPNQRCVNCLNNQLGCPGHYGLIKTPPFVHPELVTIVTQIMNSICHGCGGLLQTKRDLAEGDVLKYQGVNRLKQVYELIKDKAKTNPPTCPTGGSNCGNMYFIKEVGHPKDGHYMYKGYKSRADMAEDSKKKTKKDKLSVVQIGINFDPKEIETILAKVTPETSELLGLHGRSPANFVTRGIIVLPYALRQDYVVNGVENEDDFTYIFDEIVGSVIAYNKAKNAPSGTSNVEGARMDLYRRYAYLFNNYTEMSKPGKNNKPLKSYKSELQGKEAIIRQWIQAKRVQFAGRTVAGPGAYQRVDEIGIPEVDAHLMTRPITVREYNFSTMNAIFDDHKFTYIVPGPGHGNCPYRGQLLSKERFIKLVSPVISIGDIIERFMQDGDILLVNRQPSLHKYSFAAFRVKLHKDLTIKINLGAVDPFNADFDGDELNYHLVQDIDGYAEASYLFATERNYIDDANLKPIYGITQNSLTAFHIMLKPEQVLLETVKEQEQTKLKLNAAKDAQESTALQRELKRLKEAIKKVSQETRVAPEIFKEIIKPAEAMPDFPTLRERCQKYGVPWGSNRCLVSSIFPARLVYVAHGLEIREGILIKGVPSKKDIGTSGRTGGNVLTTIATSLGGQTMIDTISVAQLVANLYLRFTGFSVGFDDCVVNEQEMRREIQDNLKRADLRIRQLWMTKDIKKMTKQEKIQMEKKFVEIMGNAATEAGNIVDKYYDKDNALMIMAETGAKGDASNAAQMNLMYGPTLVDGKLPKQGTYGRTIPAYDPKEPTMQSTGFCATSFGEGLSLLDLFDVNRVGRAGIMAKFVETAKPGDLLHIMMRFIEDAIISADGRVRYENDMTVQLVYADNGYNPARLITADIDGEVVPFFCNPMAMAEEINNEYLVL